MGGWRVADAGSGSQDEQRVLVRMEGGRGKKGRAGDAGIWPGGKEETRRATEGLQNMEGSRNGPMCRTKWGEVGGQSAPGTQQSRFQRSHIPQPGRVVRVFSQGPRLVAGPGLHPEPQ